VAPKRKKANLLFAWPLIVASAAEAETEVQCVDDTIASFFFSVTRFLLCVITSDKWKKNPLTDYSENYRKNNKISYTGS